MPRRAGAFASCRRSPRSSARTADRSSPTRAPAAGGTSCPGSASAPRVVPGAPDAPDAPGWRGPRDPRPAGCIDMRMRPRRTRSLTESRAWAGGRATGDAVRGLRSARRCRRRAGVLLSLRQPAGRAHPDRIPQATRVEGSARAHHSASSRSEHARQHSGTGASRRRAGPGPSPSSGSKTNHPCRQRSGSGVTRNPPLGGVVRRSTLRRRSNTGGSSTSSTGVCRRSSACRRSPARAFGRTSQTRQRRPSGARKVRTSTEGSGLGVGRVEVRLFVQRSYPDPCHPSRHQRHEPVIQHEPHAVTGPGLVLRVGCRPQCRR